MLSIFLCLEARRIRLIKELLINEQIRAKEVKLIDEDGTQLGVMPTRQAIEIAYGKNKDLALMSASSEPYVCKIMDYSKYKYDMAKKEKENKKNQKIVKEKIVQLSAVIDVGDLNTRAKQARKFLEDGDKVKVVIRLRGRQNARPELGMRNMDKFVEMLQDIAQIDKPAAITGREISMSLSQIKKK